MQFSEFVWPLSYSVWDVFNNFLLTDATDRIKISSDQKSFFIALSLYPLSFFANIPFNQMLASDVFKTTGLCGVRESREHQSGYIISLDISPVWIYHYPIQLFAAGKCVNFSDLDFKNHFKKPFDIIILVTDRARHILLKANLQKIRFFYILVKYLRFL